jgi:hypothetical protein
VIVTGDAVAAIVKLAVLETPPPGFWTVMLALPTFVIRVPGTAAVNCVAFTKVVTSGEPFHCTVGPAVKIPPVERKLLPLTVRLNVDPPATAEPGLSDVMTGPPTVIALILNVSALEAVLPGFTTVTLALPAFAIRLPGTAAVNCVPFTKVVESGEPFHCTVAPEAKLEPLTVSVNAGPPTVAPFGLREVNVAPLAETNAAYPKKKPVFSKPTTSPKLLRPAAEFIVLSGTLIAAKTPLVSISPNSGLSPEIRVPKVRAICPLLLMAAELQK